MVEGCGGTPKDELRDPRGSLPNDIPPHTIEQANGEVQQDDHHSQHTDIKPSIKRIIISMHLNSVVI